VVFAGLAHQPVVARSEGRIDASGVVGGHEQRFS
jgi:hypothetical protein